MPYPPLAPAAAGGADSEAGVKVKQRSMRTVVLESARKAQWIFKPVPIIKNGCPPRARRRRQAPRPCACWRYA